MSISIIRRFGRRCQDCEKRSFDVKTRIVPTYTKILTTDRNGRVWESSSSKAMICERDASVRWYWEGEKSTNPKIRGVKA